MHGHPLIAFQRPTAREAMEAALELSADNPQWRFSDAGSGDDLAGLSSQKPTASTNFDYLGF